MVIGPFGVFLVGPGTLAEEALSGAAISRKRMMTRIRVSKVGIIFTWLTLLFSLADSTHRTMPNFCKNSLIARYVKYSCSSPPTYEIWVYQNSLETKICSRSLLKCALWTVTLWDGVREKYLFWCAFSFKVSYTTHIHLIIRASVQHIAAKPEQYVKQSKHWQYLEQATYNWLFHV